MTLKNIALEECGAEVIDKSSATNDNLHPAINVLNNQEDVTIFSRSQFGIVHKDYHNISLLVFKMQIFSMKAFANQAFIAGMIIKATLKIQKYKLPPTPTKDSSFGLHQPLSSKAAIPSSYKILKFLITETYGQFQTYLNQILIYVNTDIDESNENQTLNIQDLQSPKQTYFKQQNQNSELKLPLKFDKIKKEQLYFKKPLLINKNTKQKYSFHQNKQQSKEQSELYPNEAYKKHLAKRHEVKDNYSQNRSSQHEQQEEQYQEENESEKSLNKDLALLALSKNVMEMEQNVQNIKRQLEVLNLKINMSFEKFQNKVINKVEHMVESKIKKLKNELKLQMKKQREELQMTNRHKKSKRQDHYKSKQSRQSKSIQEYELIPHKKDKLLPKKANKQMVKQQEKQVLVASLMNKLAKKLQERELKMKKIEIKRSKQEISKRHTIHQM